MIAYFDEQRLLHLGEAQGQLRTGGSPTIAAPQVTQCRRPY